MAANQITTTGQPTPDVAMNILQSAMDAAEGRAFQSIAQSIAISVQDAVDNLRNIETISATATGVAMAQYLATQNDAYVKVMTQAQTLMEKATQNYQDIGNAAASVAKAIAGAFQR